MILYNIPLQIDFVECSDLHGMNPRNREKAVSLNEEIPDVIFQNSRGEGVAGGELRYFDGVWKWGTPTGVTGHFVIDPNPEATEITYELTYKNSTQTIENSPVHATPVLFQTIQTLIQIVDSAGKSLPREATNVEYGVDGEWFSFGSGKTTKGIARMELLPGTYSFRLAYANATNTIQQDISENPRVLFKTVKTQVQLRDSAGNPLEGTNLQIYSEGEWLPFGKTATTGGNESMELLPETYYFYLTYAYAEQRIRQNIADNPIVKFGTKKIAVELRNSEGTLFDTGTDIEYYARGVWHPFASGQTSQGQVSMELLPINYAFRLVYGNARKNLFQNVSNDPIVVFQTRKVTIELRNQDNELIDLGDDVRFRSMGEWHPFGIGYTVGGRAEMQMLPNAYAISLTYSLYHPKTYQLYQQVKEDTVCLFTVDDSTENAIWYVDALASPGGDGTLSHPFQTLADAEDASLEGDTLIVLAAPAGTSPLKGGIRLKNNQKLLGSCSVVDPDGKPSLTRATITSDALGDYHSRSDRSTLNLDAVTLAFNNEVANLEIVNPLRHGIWGNDVTGIFLHDNWISGFNALGKIDEEFSNETPRYAFGYEGIRINQTRYREDPNQFVIQNNRISDSSSIGILIAGNDTSTVQGLIEGNTISNLDGSDADIDVNSGIFILGTDQSVVSVNIANTVVNEIKNGNDGIVVAAFGSSQVVASFDACQVYDNEGAGISVMSSNSENRETDSWVGIKMQYCDLLHNDGEGFIYFNPYGESTHTLDLGGGEFESEGFNRFIENGEEQGIYKTIAAIRGDLIAKTNWWGSSEGVIQFEGLYEPLDACFSFLEESTLITDPFLTEDPK